VLLNEETRRNSSRFFALCASSNASTAADALLRLASSACYARPAMPNSLQRNASGRVGAFLR